VREQARQTLSCIVPPQRNLSVGPSDHSLCVGTLHNAHMVAHAVGARHSLLCCLTTMVRKSKLELVLKKLMPLNTFHWSRLSKLQFTSWQI